MINMRPNKREGLTPAKKDKKIGLADQKTMKFFELNKTYLNVWLICDGEKTIDEIANEFLQLVIKNAKNKKKIDKEQILNDVKKIINTLLKFNLIE